MQKHLEEDKHLMVKRGNLTGQREGGRWSFKQFYGVYIFRFFLYKYYHSYLFFLYMFLHCLHEGMLLL